MKRQIMKSIKALFTGVMTLCVASFSITSCYDDSALNSRIDGVENKVNENLELLNALKTQIEALSVKADKALYTLNFQVTADGKLQYTLDGTTWKDTGITVVEECACPEVALVDNGDSVTIKVGDQSFTIEYPQEIVFEIRAGKVYFESEGTQKVAIKSSGVEDITVISYPKGWYAEIASDGQIEVTAPDFNETLDEEYWDSENYTWVTPIPTAAAEGYVKVHACAADGKCMVGKLPVIVSAQPVSVKAYDGNAHFYATGNSAAEFYYGASPKESFEAEVAKLIEDFNDGGYGSDLYPSNYDKNSYENLPYVTANISDLLGAEVEAGKEYVVWAIIYDEWKEDPYTMDDFIISYYSLVDVTAVEDESERTPYNVTVTVNVTGADSYYAVAIPDNYAETEDDVFYYKENLIMSLTDPYGFGPAAKLYTSSYTGSVLDIAEGTTASMSGNYAPKRKIYLFILPIDGRSLDEYTTEDIYTFDFTTANATAGGAVNATATPVTKYVVEEWDNTLWQHVTVEKEVDKYSQLAVEVKPSSDDWYSFYYQWMSDEDWQVYGDSDALLVDYLLEGNGMTQDDIEDFPYYAVENTSPETTLHFVAMFIDETGKYGTLAKYSGTTDKVTYSDIDWDLTATTTNLTTEKVLKNTTTLEITPALTKTASKYKYVWTETGYYNPFEGKEATEMATAIHLGQISYYDCVTVNAADLVDGKIAVPKHYYGSNYYLAVLPYDEAGNPGEVAAIFEYSCSFVLDNVITDSTAFVNAPAVVVNVPTINDIYAYGEEEDGACAVYEKYTNYDGTSGCSYYFEVNCKLTPVEGTEVAAAFVDANGWESFAKGDAASRAACLWQKSFGSWYTYIVTEDFESSNRSFSYNVKSGVPDVYLAVSWKDADGNYYYTEFSVKDALQIVYDKMYNIVNTPDGKQLAFTWEEMGAAPSVLDLGVTTPGYLAVAYDAAALYGEEGLPQEMIDNYTQYMSWEYEVSATDATSGVITLKSYNMYGELQTTDVTYTGWDGKTCVVNSEMLMLTDVTMTVSDSLIPVYIDQAGGTGAL